MAKQFHELTHSATDFAADDYIAVDGATNKTRKMSKDDLLAKTAQNALGSIKNLSTIASESDLVAGKYLPLDGIAGTEKLPAEILATLKYIYSNFACKEYAETQTGVLFIKEIKVSLDCDKIYIKVDGQNGLVSSNTLNVDFKRNGTIVQTKTINKFGEWLEFEITPPFDTISINRLGTGIVGSGVITISFIPRTLSNAFILDVIDNLASNLNTFVNGKKVLVYIDLSNPTSGYYYKGTGEKTADAGSVYKDVVLSSDVDGKRLTIKVASTTGATDARAYLLCDENDNIVADVTNRGIHNEWNDEYTFPIACHTGYVLKASWSSSNASPTISFVEEHVNSFEENLEFAKSPVMYVSTDGNDDYDGSIYSPKKTITGAISAGAGIIHVNGGVYTDNTLNLALSKCDNIVIKGEVGKKVIFKRSLSKIVDDGSEELVSGYTKVYSVSSSEPSYTSGEKWLFFDGLDDARTAISVSEAMPNEMGRFYRCDCTKIVRTTSSTLSDALSEIENCGANEYKWFYNGGKIYFNRSASTSIYPLYKSVGNFFNIRSGQSLEIDNIEFRYGVVNLFGLQGASVVNCAAKCVYGSGAFSYGDSLDITFDNCEASLAFYGVNGDGFNGQCSGTPSGKPLQTKLINCWSHDNNDDGYSDHGYGESFVLGGLYEYNKKGGITPSYGTHCTCIGVIARGNYSGFVYIGAASDAGNAGQINCFNCVSIGNTSTDAKSGGFRCEGDYNKMRCYRCNSFNDKNGWHCYSNTGTIMELHDCRCFSPTNANKSGGGTYVIENGSLVE